jgi:hypothetical protein
MQNVTLILNAIASFHPSHSTRRAAGQEWLDLDQLLQELSAVAPASSDAVKTLLGVFERFPRHDGYGVFWSLLQYIEQVPGYETELIRSLRRQPNHMTTTMLQRLINSGVRKFDGIDLTSLLRELEPLVPEVTFEL